MTVSEIRVRGNKYRDMRRPVGYPSTALPVKRRPMGEEYSAVPIEGENVSQLLGATERFFQHARCLFPFLLEQSVMGEFRRPAGSQRGGQSQPRIGRWLGKGDVKETRERNGRDTPTPLRFRWNAEKRQPPIPPEKSVL